MEKCSISPIPVQKGDKFSLAQCPINDLEWKQMEAIPYASVVGSIMYAQICTQPDISFAIGMLGRYQSNRNGTLESCKESSEILTGNKISHAYI